MDPYFGSETLQSTVQQTVRDEIVQFSEIFLNSLETDIFILSHGIFGVQEPSGHALNF